MEDVDGVNRVLPGLFVSKNQINPIVNVTPNLFTFQSLSVYQNK